MLGWGEIAVQQASQRQHLLVLRVEITRIVLWNLLIERDGLGLLALALQMLAHQVRKLFVIERLGNRRLQEAAIELRKPFGSARLLLHLEDQIAGAIDRFG